MKPNTSSINSNQASLNCLQDQSKSKSTSRNSSYNSSRSKRTIPTRPRSPNWNERELICIAWHSRAFTVDSFHFRPARRRQYGFISVTTLWSSGVIVTRPRSDVDEPTRTRTQHRPPNPSLLSNKWLLREINLSYSVEINLFAAYSDYHSHISV